MSAIGSTSPLEAERTTPVEAQAAADPYAEIAALARETRSEALFMRNVLRCVTRFFGSPYAALHIRYAAEVVQDDDHFGATDPNFWKAGLQDFLTDSLGARTPRAKLLRARSGDAKVAFLSAPVVADSEASEGAMALVVAPITDAELPVRLAVFEALVRYASLCAEWLRELNRRGEANARRVSQSGGDKLTPAMAHSGQYACAEELAFSITNELRNKLGLEQAALGLVTGKRVRVLAISGLDQVNRRSPGVRSLTAAMEECLDADEPVAYHGPGGWPERESASRRRLHKQWHTAAKGDAVASVPLRVEGIPVAILSLRRHADKPFDRQKLEELCTRVEPYAPALLLARTAGRSLMRHAMDSARAVGRSLLAPGRYGRKAVAGVAVLAALGFFFGSVPYRLTVPCVVTAARMRHIATPYEGILAAAYVVEGDRVRAGDVLCEFDRRDIDQQLAALTAELDVLEREKDRAMADESPSDVQLARANQMLVQARLAIMQSRAERATVRAPYDGVIVAGDLRPTIGALIPQGSPLFQIAPFDAWRLELAVPQWAIGELSAGLDGVFVSYARPEEPRSFRLARLLGTAQIRGDQNVFVAEAEIKAADERLRPGMEGVAKIHVGSRAPSWLTFHRMADWLRMKLWL